MSSDNLFYAIPWIEFGKHALKNTSLLKSASTAGALVRDPRNQPLLNSQNESCNMQCLFTYETERARRVAPRSRAAAFGFAAAGLGLAAASLGTVPIQLHIRNSQPWSARQNFTTHPIHKAKTRKNSAKATEPTLPPVLPHMQNIKCTSAELKDEKLQVLKGATTLRQFSWLRSHDQKYQFRRDVSLAQMRVQKIWYVEGLTCTWQPQHKWEASASPIMTAMKVFSDRAHDLSWPTIIDTSDALTGLANVASFRWLCNQWREHHSRQCWRKTWHSRSNQGRWMFFACSWPFSWYPKKES